MDPNLDRERIKRMMQTTPAEVADLIGQFHSHDGLEPEINLILSKISFGLMFALKPADTSPSNINVVKVLVETAFALGRKSRDPHA